MVHFSTLNKGYLNFFIFTGIELEFCVSPLRKQCEFNLQLLCKGSSILVSVCYCYFRSHLRSVWRCQQCSCYQVTVMLQCLSETGVVLPLLSSLGIQLHPCSLEQWLQPTNSYNCQNSCDFCDKHYFQDKDMVQGALAVASLKHQTMNTRVITHTLKKKWEIEKCVIFIQNR